MTKPAILALDQGTTSSRAILFDADMNIITSAQKEFAQIYPQAGWVEHDPEAIWDTSLWAAKEMLAYAGENGFEIKSIGITNQRETTIVWDRKTGKPIYNAIVWQDRRTAKICADLKAKHSEQGVTDKTGLLVDPYFSATKIAWILDNVAGARGKARRGELAFGTVDTFLISRLTGGAVHATDATNASRTNVFNIMSGDWDEALCNMFNVPESVLPQVLDSADDYGMTDAGVLGATILIGGVAGDQQAAAIGQACFEPGDIKSTYGTGCFVILNTGAERARSKNRLLSTVAYRLGGKITYALEGSIFMAGATLQWLRDGLEIIDDAAKSEALIEGTQAGNDGVYMVPAFTGMGAPYWDPDARGAIIGMTRDTGRAEFIRAAIEAVCYQTYDLFKAMADDGVEPASLKVDGGMSANNLMCQYLSDILNIPVQRPAVKETTAMGAAWLAGYKAGIYPGPDAQRAAWKSDRDFAPNMEPKLRKAALAGWADAVARIVK